MSKACHSMPKPKEFGRGRERHERTALVTGSSGGIGLEIARALARAGHAVAVHGLAPEATLKEVAAEMQDLSGRPCVWSSHDLSNPLAARDLVAFAAGELGRLDVLVNNAGVQHTAPIEDFAPERWDFVLNVNLSSAFHAMAAALPGMKARGWGRILNVASAHGLVASATKAAYVAAKHGLVGLTKVAALECAQSGVTCNAICPGWVKTPLVEKQIEARAAQTGVSLEEAERALLLEKQPTGRFVRGEDVGALAAFLASEAGQSITGASMAIDGAWTAQ